MERGGIVCNKVETVYSSVGQPSYATADHLAAQAAAPSSWLGKGRKRRALIWGITSTVLSAIGLIGLALFEQYNGMLSELRSDLKHFSETSGDYVKKEKLHKSWDLMKECSQEMTTSKAAREQLQRELKASETSRDEMAKQLQGVRERLAFLEGMKMARPAVDPMPPAHEGDKP